MVVAVSLLVAASPEVAVAIRDQGDAWTMEATSRPATRPRMRVVLACACPPASSCDTPGRWPCLSLFSGIRRFAAPPIRMGESVFDEPGVLYLTGDVDLQGGQVWHTT